MFRRRRDLALASDPPQRFLPWLLAMIVYLAGLSVAGMMNLAAVAERWDKGLAGTVTVQVPAEAGAEADRRIARAVALLEGTPGVISARALTPGEIMDLLEPWLGEAADDDDLPLPRLIDVRVRPGAGLDAEGLSAALADTVPGAVVDDHKETLDRLTDLTRSMELVALGLIVLVGGVAVATVVFITRTGLALHAGAIELLHLIGAPDGYIARQFQGQALELALKGGMIGLALAAATVWVLARLWRRLDGLFVPDLAPSSEQWLALAALPFAVALIAVLTARITVMRALRRLP
ncbi:MAG TPA: FtsX-like permease family protein [Alphaproteobacteria bacterium]